MLFAQGGTATRLPQHQGIIRHWKALQLSFSHCLWIKNCLVVGLIACVWETGQLAKQSKPLPSNTKHQSPRKLPKLKVWQRRGWERKEWKESKGSMGYKQLENTCDTFYEEIIRLSRTTFSTHSLWTGRGKGTAKEHKELFLNAVFFPVLSVLGNTSP